MSSKAKGKGGPQNRPKGEYTALLGQYKTLVKAYHATQKNLVELEGYFTTFAQVTMESSEAVEVLEIILEKIIQTDPERFNFTVALLKKEAMDELAKKKIEKQAAKKEAAEKAAESAGAQERPDEDAVMIYGGNG